MKRILLGLIFTFFTIHSFSQQIENVHFEQDGKMINIYYDLISEDIDQKFNISIHYSLNNGLTWSEELEMVTGEVGENIVS